MCYIPGTMSDSERPTTASLLVPAVIFAALFFVPQWYWREYEYEKAYAYYQCADYRRGFVMSVPQYQEPYTDAGQSQKDFCAELWWHWTWVVSWVIAAITAAYCVFAGLQWWAIREQGENTKTAADAAKLNALAMINAERPWITVEVKNSAEGYWYFMAKNIGRTPAKLISIHGEVIIKKHNESFPAEPIYGPARSLYLHPRIFPPEFKRMIHDCYATEFPATMKEGIADGTLRMFLIGKVVYS